MDTVAATNDLRPPLRWGAKKGGNLIVGTKRLAENSAEGHPNGAKRVAYSNTPSSAGVSESRIVPLQGSSEHLLSSVLSQQMSLFSKMLKM